MLFYPYSYRIPIELFQQKSPEYSGLLNILFNFLPSSESGSLPGVGSDTNIKPVRI